MKRSAVTLLCAASALSLFACQDEPTSPAFSDSAGPSEPGTFFLAAGEEAQSVGVTSVVLRGPH